MKNSYLLIMCIFLLIGQSARGESVTKKIHFSHSELRIEPIKGEDGEVYIRMYYPNTEYGDEFGHPALPIRYVTISLPYAADEISLKVQKTNTSSHTLSRRLFPTQEQERTSLEERERIFKPCEKNIYNSSLNYPSDQARITEISCSGHGGRHVVVAVYPAVYFPSENRYDFSEDISITLSYNISPLRVQSQVNNRQTRDIGIPFYEYCVITSQALKDAFTRLIAWKREKGLNAGVVCKEDILSNAYIVGDTVSSIYDDAGKIRQYLQYAYASGVTKYVLFGGNFEVLPIRYGTSYNHKPDSIVKVDNNIPTDLYFSDLNSNWNKDNDSHYGEPHFAMDYGAELYVGRILCTNSEEIRNYTDKLLRYELNPGNGDFSYLKKALYTQEDEIQGNHEQDSVAAQLHCIFPIDTIFSEQPSYYASNPSSPYGSDVIAEMNQHYGYISWGGHGAPTSITVKTGGINNIDPKFAITSIQADTIPWITHEPANGLDNLTNKDYPMFAYSISCTITPFDTIYRHASYPNIGQSFTLGKNYGGPILVGNTRNGYGITSKNLQKKFNTYLINNDPIVGFAQNYAKTNYFSHYLHLSSNIIGCPNVRVWTDIPNLFSATSSYTTSGYVITANGSITDSEIGIRDIVNSNETINSISFNPSQGATTLTNAENCLITLTGKNCLPQILPLTIQNATLEGAHHIIAKNVTCGRNVRIGAQGDVVFEMGSNYTFETKGIFMLNEGVIVKKGAQLQVIPSEINY